MSMIDVIIVGGGPGGLQAALSLGRARKRVLLCDAGPRRNALAHQVHNFLTQDGTTPDELRRIGRAQLARYPAVEVRDLGVAAIEGARGGFRVALADGEIVEARRVLLCTGMIDDMLPIEGFRERWGHSIFQCPYCHGWEAQDRAWGFLVTPQSLAHAVPFAIQLTGWSPAVAVFANGLALDAAPLLAAGIRVEPAPVARITAEAVVLADGRAVPCEALFAAPAAAAPGRAGARARGRARRRWHDRHRSDAARDLGSRDLCGGRSELADAGRDHGRGRRRPCRGDDQPRPRPGGGRVRALFVFATACAAHPQWGHLDDPSRDAWQQPETVIRAMALTPTMTVADVGAGTGYFTVRLARAVPQGQVIATDVDPELLHHIEARTRLFPNVRTVLASRAASGLAPESVDAILVVHVWHHLADRAAYARDLAAALRPGGRAFVVDFAPSASHGPPAHMRLSSAQVVADLAGAGLDATLSPVALPEQYLVEATRAPR